MVAGLFTLPDPEEDKTEGPISFEAEPSALGEIAQLLMWIGHLSP